MNPIIITLVLAGVFFQGQEDQEVAQGIAFFEKGDFKNAQRCFSKTSFTMAIKIASTTASVARQPIIETQITFLKQDLCNKMLENI